VVTSIKQFIEGEEGLQRLLAILNNSYTKIRILVEATGTFLIELEPFDYFKQPLAS